MNIAAEHETAKASAFAALAEKYGNELAGEKNWHASERYWKLAARWQRKLKKEPECKRCLVSAAECFVSIGEGFLTGPRVSAGGAAHWMARAVAALRAAGGDPKRIENVHLRLLELQQKLLGESRRCLSAIFLTSQDLDETSPTSFVSRKADSLSTGFFVENESFPKAKFSLACIMNKFPTRRQCAAAI